MERARLASPPLTAAVVAVALIAAGAIWVRARLDDAARYATTAQGQALLGNGPALWMPPAGDGASPGEHHQARLQRLFATYRADGLRFAALYDAATGLVLWSVGTPARPIGTAALREGSWARVAQQLPPPPPGDAARAPARFRDTPPWLVIEYDAPIAARLYAQAALVYPIAAAIALALVAAALWAARAIRQRARLREQLARDRHLAELGQMSAVLAHELRNPLASLKGNAQLLEETLVADDLAKARRVVAEATRLELLIANLLDFARGAVARTTVCAARDLVADAASEVGGIEVAGDDDEDARVDVDPVRFRQALLNVLRNAVEAQPAARAPRASVRVDGDRAEIVVRDFGPGLPAGDVDVFRPFYTTKPRGVGLGLAVTRQIVELHGGTIAARNGAGGGAEVIVRVPRARAGAS